MKIEIVIPTIGREKKLLKCLGSIEENKVELGIRLFVYIYFSIEKEYETLSHKLLSFPWIFTNLIKEYDAASFWNKHFKEHNGDITFYLNDDVILAPDCLRNAIESMPKSLDAVVGLRQENLPEDQCVKTAFGAIGREFKERFPNKQVFFPRYKRFYLDKELEEYSTKTNTLIYCKEAKLIHCHPAFDSKYMDETHADVRKYLREDKRLYENRKKRGLLWGDSYEF